ncbi:AlkA N-terminal domain-containing protein [Phycicoccus sp. SLBN-51]|uniref:DNA-3-methyladenine glycosylase 2 family protein n=1 Tax=Phycicoccus sp. SLBN-51 TaxID=2768447 RepID=UPI0011526935|nr:AlkA N-terminal domain-containing protein [Phycicoccus sp. SLBN-51]TQJ50110.1 DNA-3-methyladenine glycosylase II [Phycicoccus sp. SLBN-51]
MHEDTEACVRAVQAKDARFDGWFFTAVLTTGIYCRPSCPVVPPKPRNMRFYPSAAAAQAAGFRACKRCRPDASPGSPEWSTRADTTARAMRLIADGVVDREGVSGLARRLGYSTRQVERVVAAELGAGPLALARAQRAQTARTLIESSDLPMTEVAWAAGFSSLRSFNATVQAVFALTPTELRRRRSPSTTPVDREAAAGGAWHHVALRLPFRASLLPDSLFGHLVETRVPGVEEWRGGAYRRSLRLPHGPAVVALTPQPDHVAARVWLTDLRDLGSAVARCRALLDLDADPTAVDEHLSHDLALRSLVAAAPGRRVPRTVDAEELAMRVVLGQQVSTAAARRLAARLVADLGEPLTDPDGGLTHVFPSPDAVAALDPATLAMPGSRARTLVGLAGALASGDVRLGPGEDWAAARATLMALPGIGAWSVEMVAMRGLGDPDAFPASDLAVRSGLAQLGLAGRAALAEAQRRWRPWGAYAVQHLWCLSDHAAGRLPEEPGTAEPGGSDTVRLDSGASESEGSAA